MKRRIIVLVLIMSTILIVLNRKYLNSSPLSASYYSFNSISDVYLGTNKKYIIDENNTQLSVINETGDLVDSYIGGSESKDFCYANKVFESSDDKIYLADVVYRNNSEMIEKERIIQLSKKGDTVIKKIIYEKKYDRTYPINFGNILEIKEKDGKISFIEKDASGFGLYLINLADCKVQPVEEFNCANVKSASYDWKTNIAVATTKSGEVKYKTKRIRRWVEVIKSDPENPSLNNNPWKIDISNGEVYFTDLSRNKLVHFSTLDDREPDIVFLTDDLIGGVSWNPAINNVLISATNSYVLIPIKTVCKSVICEKAQIDKHVFTICVWVLLFISIPFYLYGFYLLIKYIVDIFKQKKGFYRVFLVGLCTMIVSLITSYATFLNMYNKQKAEIYSSLDVYENMLKTYINPYRISNLKNVSNYGDLNYRSIKNNLDKMINASSESGKNFYYTLYFTDNTNINYMMDYGDTSLYGRPLCSYSDEDYSYPFKTGQEKIITEQKNLHGICAVKLVPIFDSKAKVIATLEVGTNIESLKASMYTSLFDNLFSTIVTSLVITMIILEVMFTLSFYEQRKVIEHEYSDSTMALPLRTITCVSYLADAMQNAFIVILIKQMYENESYIQILPIGLAIALPLFIQLLAMIIVMIVLPKVIQGKSTKLFSISGFVIQILGFMTCCIMKDYAGIFVGKLIIGLGMGVIYVTVNTLAERGKDISFCKKAYSGISAGSIVGATIGMGMSSILLQFGNYRLIYAFGALFLVGGLILVMGEQKYDFKDIQNTSGITTKKFVLQKQHITFTLLIFIPCMIVLAYREFFFPLYAKSQGITETHIGQILFICGMIILYIGPNLSKSFLLKLGAKRSIILANAMMVLTIGLYLLAPSIYTVIISVLLLSTIVSFAYSCHYAYYEEMPDRIDYGNTRAMRVFNTTKNMGKALGPIVFGLVCGVEEQGFKYLMVAVGVLTVIFTILYWSGVKEYSLNPNTAPNTDEQVKTTSE